MYGVNVVVFYSYLFNIKLNSYVENIHKNGKSLNEDFYGYAPVYKSFVRFENCGTFSVLL